MMRKALAAAALSLALVLPASASAIPQGYYDSCSVAASSVDVCARRAELVGSAGFKYITASADGTATQLQAYSQRAHAAGVKVMWQINWDAGGSAVAAKIKVLKGLTATWGYVLPDEPSLAQHDQMKVYANWAALNDPNHPRWINLLGSQALSDWADLDALKSRVNYPINNQAPSESVNWWIYDSTRQNLNGYDGVVLQSWRIGDSYYDSGGCWCYTDSRWPTVDETAAAKDGVTRIAGVQFIMYFWLPDTAGWAPGTRPWYWADFDTGQRFETIRQGAMSGFCQWQGCQ